MKTSPHYIALPLLALSLAFSGCGEKSDPSAAAADDGYPLTTCVVSGEPLDSMGGPIEVTHEGVTVKLCCDSCTDEFKSDVAKYAAILEAAR